MEELSDSSVSRLLIVSSCSFVRVGLELMLEGAIRFCSAIGLGSLQNLQSLKSIGTLFLSCSANCFILSGERPSPISSLTSGGSMSNNSV